MLAAGMSAGDASIGAQATPFTPEALQDLCEWMVDYCLETYGMIPGFENVDRGAFQNMSVDGDDYSDDDDDEHVGVHGRISVRNVQGRSGGVREWDRDMDMAEELMLRPNRSATDVNRAISLYERARGLIPRATQPMEWGECSAAIGFAYTEKEGESNSEQREDALDKAKGYLVEALEVLTQSAHPQQFAEVHDQLGTVHLEKQRGSRPDSLASAIESFQKCLEVYTEAGNPQERAEVQGKLREAYQEAAGMMDEEEYDNDDFIDGF